MKKPSGGRIWSNRGKRKREMGSEFIEPRIGATKRVAIRTSGGGQKMRLFSAEIANVTDLKAGQVKKAKIKTVVENPADLHFVRRNVLTKGAIIDTELGRARVTSRPGQNGSVDAVLIEQKKA